jgi:hypothetical protein
MTMGVAVEPRIAISGIDTCEPEIQCSTTWKARIVVTFMITENLFAGRCFKQYYGVW